MTPAIVDPSFPFRDDEFSQERYCDNGADGDGIIFNHANESTCSALITNSLARRQQPVCFDDFIDRAAETSN